MPSSQASEEGAVRQRTLSELRQENIFVTVRGDGTITVDEKPATMAELPDVLERAARQRDAVELVLDAADDVGHETVVQVIDAAAGAQIERVHFVQRVGRGPGGRSPPGNTSPPSET